MAETQVAKVTPVEEIKQNLMRMTPEFAKILPPHVPPEKFTRVVTTAIINMPSLMDCERRTLYQACVQAATDGLMPDGREGAIVPFAGRARWMPMIAGICKKVRNSGEIGDIDAQVVHQNDAYEAWIDEKGRHFKWTKARGERGEPVLTFAYALGRDGTFYFEEVSEDDMTRIEAAARAKDSPWKGPFRNEMKRKSALRRLAKYRLPQSTDLQNLTQTEDDLYQEPTVPGAPAQPGIPNRLKDIVNKQTATDTEVSKPSKSEIPFGDAPQVPI